MISLIRLCAGLSVLSMHATASAHAGGQGELEAQSTAAARSYASETVRWQRPGYAAKRADIAVQLLGINDFHGQLSAGKLVDNRPVGSAAVLAAYLKHEQASFAGTSFIVHAGDHVGASPPASALLQDEPAIAFLNLLTDEACASRRTRERCNVIGTLGNHEFDDGVTELLRLIRGGQHASGPFLDPEYAGARFPYVCANVVDADSGEPILPPYVIRRAGSARIGFIGAVLEQTPSIVTPTGVAGVRFLDEAEAINRYIPELRRRGVEAIVVLIHQGGTQAAYTGPTDAAATLEGTDIQGIVSKLDGAIDVVVSGHAHAFSNALLPNAAGQPVLVVQAFSAGTAFDDVELTLDADSGDVVAKSGSIVTTWADEGPGLAPDPAVRALVEQAEARVAPLVEEVVAEAASALSRTPNEAGESALGNLIADAQRAAMGGEIAFMNPGGIRADLDAGPVTWGELFGMQPFGNSLVRLDLTGEQVYALLEQQWIGQTTPRLLQISGITYTWDNAQPDGQRVVEVRRDGAALDRAATYSVVVNSFIAAGGDNFTVLTQGTGNAGGPLDLDALIAYVQGATQPFDATIEGRIERLN
jgi:5'-nucleotidase